MKKITFVIISFTVLLFTSCKNQSLKIKEELENSYTYDGKTIELEGRFNPTIVMQRGSVIDAGIEIYNDYFIIQTGNTSVTVTLNYGNDKNSMMINTPENESHFKDTDVVIYDKDGNKLTTNDKVKITGTVKYPNKGPKKGTTKNFATGVITPEKGNDYNYDITNIIIEKL